MNTGNRVGRIAGVLLLGAVNGAQATEESTMNDLDRWAQERTGSEWAGPAELWIDPAGNEAETSDATLQVRADGVEYTWAWRGAPHTGELSWGDDGLRWRDSWHQPETVDLTAVAGQGALLAAEYSYPAGSGPDWHWRIKLAQRPDESLVLQMTNIAPWGEEARAVRMVLRHKD